MGRDKGAREGCRADLGEGKGCSVAGQSRRQQRPSAAALAAGGRREGVAGCWEKGEHKNQGHILESSPGSETSREEVEQHGQPPLNQQQLNHHQPQQVKDARGGGGGGPGRGRGGGGGGRHRGGVLAGHDTARSDPNKNYKVIFYNSYSILSKIDLLRAECPIMKPDVILIAESFCRPDISDAYLHIAGYETVCRRDGRDTAGGRGRGLLV